MPRIPVRTEPYASPFRQHRHYKSKRDIILKALGKSSYINGSQFAVLFISARGDVETYASELLQDVVGLPRDAPGGGATGAAEDGDRTRTLWRDEVVREKRDFVQRTGERRRQEVQEKRGMMGAVEADKEDEGEGSESDEEREREGSPSRGGFRPAPGVVAAAAEQHAGRRAGHCRRRRRRDRRRTRPRRDARRRPRAVPPRQARGLGVCALDPARQAARGVARARRALGRPLAGHARAAGPNRRYAAPRRARAARARGRARTRHTAANTVTPARAGRPASISLSAFKTPAPPTARTIAGHKASLSAELQQAYLAGGSVSRRPRAPANADLFMPSTPIRPLDSEGPGPSVLPLADAPAAAASTSSAAVAAAAGPSSQPGATTHVLNIPMDRLSDYLIERFNALQQTTCKLVVKTWIKVVEPKKQTRYPYNKGEASKPAWWPEGVRHREPDHLMKPERTHLLLAILLKSSVPAIKLELSTAEMSAYISQSKMKILREIYAVAKEEQRRDGASDAGDLVVRLNGSPVDVKAVLPNSTPDPARLCTSHTGSPAIPYPAQMLSAKKRKGAEAVEAAEADKENAPSSSQGVPGALPFSSLKLKRARANSTLETYGNGHGEQVSPLRRLSNMNISTPFSGSPLIREPATEGMYGQPGSHQGSPYLSAQYSPAMLPTWSTGNTSSPIHPGSGFQVYPVAGPGPAMSEAIKKRNQARPSTGPPSTRQSNGSVSRLPLPSLHLPPQDPRAYNMSAEYFSASTAAPSPVMMAPAQPVYYTTMPQQGHQGRGMPFSDQHLGAGDPTLSHSPFLVSTPVPPPVSSLAYPYATMPQHDSMGFYDAFSPLPGGGSGTGGNSGQMQTDGMFAFTPTLAGEQGDVPEDEYVWTQAS